MRVAVARRGGGVAAAWRALPGGRLHDPALLDARTWLGWGRGGGGRRSAHRGGHRALELLDRVVEAGGVRVVDGGLALHVGQLGLGARP